MHGIENAVAVCLISFFSATLVVLIARSLDNQAAREAGTAVDANRRGASHARIGVESPLRTSRGNGNADDGLVVYYSTATAVATCRAIESQTHETVKNDFADRFESGQIVESLEL